MADAVSLLHGGPPPAARGRAGVAVGSSRARRLALAAAYTVGAAAVLAAAAVLHDVAPGWRTLLVGIGLVLGYHALKHGARAVASREVDVSFGLSLAWLGLLGAAAVLAPVLPLGQSEDTSKTLLVPGFLRPDLFSDHPLGTNQQGLDILARVVWGGRESLSASILAVLIGITLGGLLGVIAGYFGGLFDGVIGIFTSVGLAFPPLVLLLVVAAALPDGILGLAVTLSVFVVPTTIRIARANTLAVAQRDYALAARLLGASRWQVARREVIPHVLPPLISMALLILPLLIVAEASLNFLGLGVAAPAPSWGNMISEGSNGVFEENPHIVLVPGAVLFITVFVLNALGQRVSRVWDPRRNKL
jgi:peptide/nickel transport system permease protein